MDLGNVHVIAPLDEKKLCGKDREALIREYNVVVDYKRSARGELGLWRKFRRFSPALVDRLAMHLGGRAPLYRPDPSIYPFVRKTVEEKNIQLVVGRYLEGSCACGFAELGIPALMDVDDLETEPLRYRLHSPHTSFAERLVSLRHLMTLNRVVPRYLSKFDAHFVANEMDKNKHGLMHAHWLPNIPFPRKGERTFSAAGLDTKNIALIASWDYPPNYKGADHFISQIWPEVFQAEPDARLWIVGSRLSDDLRARWSNTPGVKVLGFVDDIAEIYASVRFTVSPVYYGGGTHIKIVESLSYGRTCVISDVSHRGYEEKLKHGECLMVAKNDQEMTGSILALLRSRSTSDRLAMQGMKIVRDTYSYQHVSAVVHKAINDLNFC